MSAPKFTPGPWHYAGAGVLMNDDGEEIALSPIYDDVPDGRLIAAAPEMFSALEEAAFALEQEADNYRDGDEYQPRGKTLHRVAKNARAALKKAGAL